MQKNKYRILFAACLCALVTFLFGACSSSVPAGVCNLNGDLAFGTSVLQPSAAEYHKVQQMVSSFDRPARLKELPRLLGRSSQGRGRDGVWRYDLWHYTMHARDCRSFHCVILAVQSERKYIRRMALVQCSDGIQPVYYGDADMASALQEVMLGVREVPGLTRAYEALVERRDDAWIPFLNQHNRTLRKNVVVDGVVKCDYMRREIMKMRMQNVQN